MLAKPETFTVICQVVAANDPTLAMMVPTNANMAINHHRQRIRLVAVASVFADRAYKALVQICRCRACSAADDLYLWRLCTLNSGAASFIVSLRNFLTQQRGNK